MMKCMNVNKFELPYYELSHKPIAETHLHVAAMLCIWRLKLE